MTKANQAESERGEVIPGAVLTSAFLKWAEIWTNAQVEVFSAVEASMADWTRRRHEVFDTWARSVQKMCESRDPVDLLQTQQNWLRDAIRLVGLDIRSLAGDTAILTSKMTTGFEKPAGLCEDVAQRRRGRSDVGESQPVERVAAE